MKLLVMSDSNRNHNNMICAVTRTNPDVIIHLGDCISDTMELRRQFPGIKLHAVRGNCDIKSSGGNDKYLTLGGVIIYMTHGHIYGVKQGFDRLILHSRLMEADIALFGHTHQALIIQEQGLYLMNPGQMEHNYGGYPATFGIITIENGTFDCDISMI